MTELPPDASALVVDADGEMKLMLAEYASDEDVPRLVKLLGAVLARSSDDDWVEEMLADFEQHDRS